MPEEDEREQITLTLFNGGDKISRKDNLIIIEYSNEDNAIIAMEIFREIAQGNTVTLGKADAV